MSETSKFEKQKNKAAKTLMTMLDYLGLEAMLRIEEKDSALVITIASPNAGRIIGRKGQTLESLQLLLNRIMIRDEENSPRILLDIDGYVKDNNRGGDRPERTDEGTGKDPEPPRRESGRRVEGRRRRDGGGAPARGAVSDEQLQQQALDAAKEVKRWGEPVTLPEMNAHDRRVIHITLQEDAEIVTRSEGDGAIKKVVVSLKKD